MGACPVTYGMTCRTFTGSGARAWTTAGRAAARCGAAGTVELKARPLAVAAGGATMVTFVTLVTLVTFVTLLMLVLVLRMLVTLVVTRMPTATTGGALVTTAGAVPTGAGTMMPRRDPGGAGTKQPSGPIARGPGITPTAGGSTTRTSSGEAWTNPTPAAAQYPLMNIPEPPRCSSC